MPTDFPKTKKELLQTKKEFLNKKKEFPKEIIEFPKIKKEFLNKKKELLKTFIELLFYFIEFLKTFQELYNFFQELLKSFQELYFFFQEQNFLPKIYIYYLQTRNLCYINGKIHKKEKNMSQNENSERGKTHAQSSNEAYQMENLCHIRDDVEDWDDKDEIRQNLCQYAEITKHTDGKHYCFFHLPTKDKNSAEFEKKITERLEAVEADLPDVTNLSEEERYDVENKFFYDFRYVIFPSVKIFRRHSFKTTANFNSAKFMSDADFKFAKFSSYADFIRTTFTSTANFRSVKFTSKAEFSFAIFTSTANFNSAKFISDAYFRTTTFTSYIYFNSATFSSNAYFSSAIFTSNTYFSLATFSSTVDFSSAKFLEASQIFLNQTSFQDKTFFRQAVIKGYLYFEAGEGKFFDGEWLDEEKTKPKKAKRESKVFDHNGSLNFAHVRVEKPERITFNKVRLHPSWFVNVDSRKFVYTDIDWKNHRAKKSELEEELIALTERGFDEPHNFQLLTISFRNLVANAEEFNRFEEASNFRKSASECERLERLNRRKTWWNDLGKHWGKCILCREFFTEGNKTLKESWKLLKEVPFDFVHFLYRWLSGYGEKWFRAFAWLFVIWFGFAFVYYFVQGFENSKFETAQIGLWDSIGYSLQVMTLQKPEPRPIGFTRFIYGLETILAPLQGALLALAIRRKFMR